MAREIRVPSGYELAKTFKQASDANLKCSFLTNLISALQNGTPEQLEAMVTPDLGVTLAETAIETDDWKEQELAQEAFGTLVALMNEHEIRGGENLALRVFPLVAQGLSNIDESVVVAAASIGSALIEYPNSEWLAEPTKQAISQSISYAVFNAGSFLPNGSEKSRLAAAEFLISAFKNAPNYSFYDHVVKTAAAALDARTETSVRVKLRNALVEIATNGHCWRVPGLDMNDVFTKAEDVLKERGAEAIPKDRTANLLSDITTAVERRKSPEYALQTLTNQLAKIANPGSFRNG